MQSIGIFHVADSGCERSGTLTNYRESADKEAKTIEMALSRLSQDVSNTKQLFRDDQAGETSGRSCFFGKVALTSAKHVHLEEWQTSRMG